MTGDLTPVRFDLTDVDIHRNQAVLDLLAERDAYFEFDGAVLVVPARHAAEVGDLLFPIPPPDHDETWELGRQLRRRPLPAHDDGSPRLAPFATRPVGWLIDLIALVVVTLLLMSLFRAAAAGDGLRLLSPPLAAAVVLVAPIARWGVSPGGALVGIRIVGVADGGRPGWRASLVRWVVPWATGIVPGLVGDLVGSRPIYVAMAAIGLIAWLTVHVTAFGDEYRRGLHDRLAGTVLVRV